MEWNLHEFSQCKAIIIIQLLLFNATEGENFEKMQPDHLLKLVTEEYFM